MARSDLLPHLQRIDKLILEINAFAPIDVKGIEEFRADLAGLLVTSMAASYESCVKETISSYASRCSPQFATYANNQYEKLNSRININDLHRYAKTFNPEINKIFKDRLATRANKIEKHTGQNICKSYENILSWRHDFAHACIRNTTIEEARKTNRFARHVIFAFNEAFDLL